MNTIHDQGCIISVKFIRKNVIDNIGIGNWYRQIIARQQSVIGLSAKLHIGASLPNMYLHVLIKAGR